MDSLAEGMTVVEETAISPPSGSVPSTIIPLTTFDLMSYPYPPVERLFLYSIQSCSESVFLETHVPTLKHSLSLTLRRFFPFAGKLLPIDPAGSSSNSVLSYTEGDGVDFTVAKSDRDFDDLLGHHPRKVKTFAGLVPKLNGGVLAIQVTLFPNSGIGVGVIYHHGAADGLSSMHFVKTWAAFSRLGATAVEPIELDVELPCIERNKFPEPPGFAESLEESKAGFKGKMINDEGFRKKFFDSRAGSDSVRATFVVTRVQLENLRRKLVSNASSPPTIYLSGFTLTTAVLWRCMVSLYDDDHDDKNEFVGFNLLSNYRSQQNSMFPTNYFGNCIIPGIVKMRRDELLGEDGLVKAAVAINEAIHIMKTKMKVVDYSNISLIFSIAGAPMLGVYQVDFGWGRPRKVEVMSIKNALCAALAENREDDDGGLEIGGVFLSGDQFHEFNKLFLALVTTIPG